jgi:purine-nucleoside phosphorylase
MSETQNEWDRIQTLAAAVAKECDLKPSVAILLGTGLGGVAAAVDRVASIAYADLPGMPMATAESHEGEVVLGHLAGVPVVAFSGRLHCYEGHAPADVVVPVRLAKALGAHTLVMGSAVGGLDPRMQVGDLVVIEDHINLMGVNPLVGPNDDRIGPRWPDMIEPYDRGLITLAKKAALDAALPLSEAVYVGVLGPNLETRAEYRMLRTLGADVVGMSTVPEATAAVHCGLKTLTFAIVTDRCLPDALEPADVSAIIAAANGAEPHLTRLVTAVLPQAAANS